MIRIISWNVNGLRGCLKNGMALSLKSIDPDIAGLQEIKAYPEQLEDDYPEIVKPLGMTAVWNPAKRKGYSGTLLLSKIKPESVQKGFGISEFDDEGRIIITKFGSLKFPFTLFNIYYPNGQMDDERLNFKMRFYDAFLEYADNLKKEGENIVVIGDFNTAHKEIDLKNPKANENYSGFLPIERAWIDKFISHGYIDTFRNMHPDSVEYSWWTYRFNSRKKNIGWRIDYVFVNEAFFPHIKESFILKDIMGSDHCPVGVLIE